MAKKRLSHDDYSFRSAKPGDFGKMVLMLGEMALFLGLEDDCLIVREDIEDRAERLTALKTALFGKPRRLEAEVVVVKNNVEGLCTYYTTFSTYRGQSGLYIEDVYISHTYRQYGLEKALMGRMAVIAQSRKCCRMQWIAPKGEGEDAEMINRFYRGLGARLEEGWNSYQQDDGLRTLAHGAPKSAKMNVSSFEKSIDAESKPKSKRKL